MFPRASEAFPIQRKVPWTSPPMGHMPLPGVSLNTSIGFTFNHLRDNMRRHHTTKCSLELSKCSPYSKCSPEKLTRHPPTRSVKKCYFALVRFILLHFTSHRRQRPYSEMFPSIQHVENTKHLKISSMVRICSKLRICSELRMLSRL